eukprot:s470_g19.t1
MVQGLLRLVCCEPCFGRDDVQMLTLDLRSSASHPFPDGMIGKTTGYSVLRFYRWKDMQRTATDIQGVACRRCELSWPDPLGQCVPAAKQAGYGGVNSRARQLRFLPSGDDVQMVGRSTGGKNSPPNSQNAISKHRSLEWELHSWVVGSLATKTRIALVFSLFTALKTNPKTALARQPIVIACYSLPAAVAARLASSRFYSESFPDLLKGQNQEMTDKLRCCLTSRNLQKISCKMGNLSVSMVYGHSDTPISTTSYDERFKKERILGNLGSLHFQTLL